MLSEPEKETLEFFLKTFSASYLVPFDYKKTKEGSLWGSKSWSKICVVSLCLLVVVGVLIHELLALFRYLDPHMVVSPETVCMHFLLIGWRLLVILIHVSNLMYRDELALLYNQVINLQKSADDLSGDVIRNRRHLYLRCFMSSSSSIGMAWGFIFLFINDKPFFVYATLKPLLNLQGPLYLALFGFLEALLNSFISCISCQVALLIQYAYMMNNKSWLRVVCQEWPTVAMEDPPAGGYNMIVRSVRYYRKFQLINGVYNQCNAQILIPGMKSTCLALAILTTYSVLRYATVFHPLYTMQFTNLASFYIVLVIALCTTASYFVGLSSNIQKFAVVVASFREKERRQLSLQLLKSCRPIAFSVGGFYSMKRWTAILVLNVFLNATFSLLISF